MVVGLARDRVVRGNTRLRGDHVGRLTPVSTAVSLAKLLISSRRRLAARRHHELSDRERRPYSRPRPRPDPPPREPMAREMHSCSTGEAPAHTAVTLVSAAVAERDLEHRRSTHLVRARQERVRAEHETEYALSRRLSPAASPADSGGPPIAHRARLRRRRATRTLISRGGRLHAFADGECTSISRASRAARYHRLATSRHESAAAPRRRRVDPRAGRTARRSSP